MRTIALFITSLFCSHVTYACKFTTDELFIAAAKRSSFVVVASITERNEKSGRVVVNIDEVFKGDSKPNENYVLKDGSGLLEVGSYYVLLLDSSASCSYAAIAETKHGTDSYVLVEISKYFGQTDS